VVVTEIGANNRKESEKESVVSDHEMGKRVGRDK
jgi:hypothetical protein